MNSQMRTNCQAAMPFLRELPADAAREGQALVGPFDNDLPVYRVFADGLVVAYLIDDGPDYRYMQNRDLFAAEMSPDELHAASLANLQKFADEKLQVYPAAPDVFAGLLGGNFEASLLLLDGVWDQLYRHVIANDFVVAIPARDILAFCDSESAEGLAELRAVVDRIWPIGDHLLTRDLYRRVGGVWKPTDG